MAHLPPGMEIKNMINFLHRFVDSDSRYQYYWGGGRK